MTLKVAMLAEFPYHEEDVYRGGVAQSNYRLIDSLEKQEGLELTVLFPSQKVNAVETRRHGKATVVFTPLRNRGYGALIGYPGIRKSFHELLRQVKPDVVHAQAAPAYVLAATQGPWPSVVTVHGVFRNESPVVKSRISLREKLAERAVIRWQEEGFRRTRNLIAITSEIEMLVKDRSPGVRVFRVNNAIDGRFFELIDRSDRPVILFIGWISLRKGVHFLLKAFESLSASLPEVELRLVGLDDTDKEYSSGLRAQYRDLIRAGRVRFLGGIPQEQLLEEISRCSVLCLPSLAESAPMVIAQAMAAGKPVVANRVGGVPDMVEEGATGRLCEPGQPAQLADCLETLLKDGDMRRAMGCKARSVAMQRYHPESVARTTLGVYREVAGSGSAARK